MWTYIIIAYVIIGLVLAIIYINDYISEYKNTAGSELKYIIIDIDLEIILFALGILIFWPILMLIILPQLFLDKWNPSIKIKIRNKSYNADKRNKG